MANWKDYLERELHAKKEGREAGNKCEPQKLVKYSITKLTKRMYIILAMRITYLPTFCSFILMNLDE